MAMTDTAQDQARAQFDSIAAMVARLEHANECTTPDECPLTAQDIADGLGYGLTLDPDKLAADREDYHDTDKAAEAIDEDPLSVQVRTDWHTPSTERTDPAEFEILLCTGGPAVRIRGTLDHYGQPDTASLDYQDWGTPWTEYRPAVAPDPDTIVAELHRYRETLLAYARQFWFGE